jgi:hypothetical protein
MITRIKELTNGEPGHEFLGLSLGDLSRDFPEVSMADLGVMVQAGMVVVEQGKPGQPFQKDRGGYLSLNYHYADYLRNGIWPEVDPHRTQRRWLTNEVLDSLGYGPEDQERIDIFAGI